MLKCFLDSTVVEFPGDRMFNHFDEFAVILDFFAKMAEFLVRCRLIDSAVTDRVTLTDMVN